MAEIKTVLTDDQIMQILYKSVSDVSGVVGMVRAIEAAVLSASNAGKLDAGTALDLFEAEQQRILSLDPRERAMQHNYSRTMAVCYEFREFIRKQAIDAGQS